MFNELTISFKHSYHHEIWDHSDNQFDNTFSFEFAMQYTVIHVHSTSF